MNKKVLGGFIAGLALGVTLSFFIPTGKSKENPTAIQVADNNSPEPERTQGLPQRALPAVPAQPATQAVHGELNKDQLMQELAKRSHAGEFLLDSDNPFSVREREERNKKILDYQVPIITANREAFLANLNVPADTIYKLTNHAARIVEASINVSSLLPELSTAKVMYDQKARQLLTPEQYQQFKEFEMKEALAAEWKTSGVENLESFSANEIRGITQSLEDMGIRESRTFAILPYEPEPKSGNMITAENQNSHEILQGMIARIKAAAADLDVIAQRHQLSDHAKQTLARMITTRQRSLNEQFANAETVEQASARHRGRIEAHLGRPLPKGKDVQSR